MLGCGESEKRCWERCEGRNGGVGEVWEVWKNVEKGVGKCVGAWGRKDVGKIVEVWGWGVWANVDKGVAKCVGCGGGEMWERY